ncbi:hypothetical protein EJV44_04525 [Ancylobacter aquaticus]|nr:hypothetical protein EJV44_04525 [Ancylobacter aquaticus]
MAMLEQHPSTQEVRELLAPFRQLMERYLYTGIQLQPEAVTALLNVFIIVDDKIAQLGDEAARKYRTLAQMEAVARDLELVGAPVRDHDGDRSRRESGGTQPAKIVPFKPRLAPRALFVPTGPGGAA